MKPFRSVLLLALLATACTRPDTSVSFGAICAPPDADTCRFASTCSTTNLGPYVIDLDQTSQLWIVIEATNRHPDNSNADVGQLNTGDAHVEEILVSYDGDLGLNPVRYPVQANVPAEGTATMSAYPIYGLAAAALPAGASGLVVAKMKAKGTFGDGGTFETAEIDIPVTVCRGCVGPPAACPTAGDQRVFCPPNPGQAPATDVCVTP